MTRTRVLRVNMALEHFEKYTHSLSEIGQSAIAKVWNSFLMQTATTSISSSVKNASKPLPDDVWKLKNRTLKLRKRRLHCAFSQVMNMGKRLIGTLLSDQTLKFMELRKFTFLWHEHIYLYSCLRSMRSEEVFSRHTQAWKLNPELGHFLTPGIVIP